MLRGVLRNGWRNDQKSSSPIQKAFALVLRDSWRNMGGFSVGNANPKEEAHGDVEVESTGINRSP